MQPSLDTVFAALSDPTRRQILTMLLEDDMAVTDVAALTGEREAKQQPAEAEMEEIQVERG